MKLKFIVIKSKLHKGTMVILDMCPVNGRTDDRKVKGRIQIVRESQEKNCKNEKLPILQWKIVHLKLKMLSMTFYLL